MDNMKTTRYYYASYGMNCNMEQMARRCPDSSFVDIVDVEGYKLTARGVLDIVRDPQCRIEMALWLISARDLRALDRLEGYPLNYDRIELLGITRSTHEPIQALAYQMVNRSYTCKLSPSYRRLVTYGYIHCGMDLSQLLHVDIQADRPRYMDLLERNSNGEI